MRRLGAALGCEAMAIYHHVRGRDELLRAIADRLLEPLERIDLGADWRLACRRFAAALRAIARDRPATFRLVGLEPLDSPESLRHVERLLTLLVAAGFDPPEALAAYRATAAYARGYALAEATGFTVDGASVPGRERLLALPREQFPILAGRAAELADLSADGGFDHGLDALLRGLPDPRALDIGP